MSGSSKGTGLDGTGIPADFAIAGRRVGRDADVFIIAEAGVNHDGDLARARELIDAACAAGADAVKFQAFSADQLAAPEAPTCGYQRRACATASSSGTTSGPSQRDMLRRLELPHDAFAAIKQHADRRGILFLCTPFGLAELDMLVTLDAPAIKIASPDIVNLPLLTAGARTGRPLIVSTGAATLEEIDAAVAHLGAAGACGRLALLHCVSAYPTATDDARLGCIAALAGRFGLPVGFSDHTESATFGALAVAAGACILEKHLTLDRAAAGPDHFFSLEPAGFTEYVVQARAARRAIGSGRIGPSAAEQEVRLLSRGSLVAARALRAGQTIAAEHLAVMRPGGGIGPDRFADVLGRTVRIDVAADTRLAWSMLD